MPPFKTKPTKLTVPGAVNVPAVIVNVPFKVNVKGLPIESVWPDFSTVMLLNVKGPLPLIACAPVVLLNTTVLEPGVNVPPLLVQFPALTVNVLVSPNKVLPVPKLTAALVV